MEPLRVTAELSSGVASYDGRIQLDAVLEWVAHCRSGDAVPEMGAPALSYEIPLERIGTGECWVWRFSEGEADWRAADLAHYTRQFPMSRAHYLIPNKRKLNIAAGPTKSFRLPLPLLLAHVVTWHGVGDRAWIEKALEEVGWLGKKHNVGHGKVRAWSVAPDPTASRRSLVRADGSAARALPLQILPLIPEEMRPSISSMSVQMVGHRPPYWHYQRRKECLVPHPPRIA